MKTPDQIEHKKRYAREYRKRNLVKRREALKRWRLENPEKKTAASRRWRTKHPEIVRKHALQYYYRHKTRVLLSRRKYQRRYKKLPHIRIRESISMRIRRLLVNGSVGSPKTVRLLGCSVSDFMIYLESKFEPGMTWDNYGGSYGWQVDHIMPCAIFDLTKPDHQKRCFHFSNLQPMWGIENRRKYSKITTNQFNLL